MGHHLAAETRPLRVCHIVATTVGATWVSEQLRELRNRHDMDVTAIVGGEAGPLVDLLCSEGIRIIPWDFGLERGRLGHLPVNIFSLARLLRRERFDVVQTHVFPSMMSGRIAGWLADVPLRVAMVAGPFHLQAKGSRASDRDTCFLDTLLVASCELTRRIYLSMGVAQDKVALVYYGADRRRFNPETVTSSGIREECGWPPDTPVVGMIAYFYERLEESAWIPKQVWGRGVTGHEEMVKAAKVVLDYLPETKFLIVGEGYGEKGNEYRREVIALTESMGISSSIRFIGHRGDVAGILKDIDVSVQASLNENLGGVLESLMMARPTVATRVGGMVDAVIHRETGLLVSPGDPADLAQAIIKLLRDPEGAAVLGQAGRKLMLERFTLDRTADDLAALYRSTPASGSFSLRRSLFRVFGSFPLFAYLAARLGRPEARLFRAWDRRRGLGTPR